MGFDRQLLQLRIGTASPTRDNYNHDYLLDEQRRMHQVPDGKNPVRSLSIASDASIVVAANNRGTFFSWKLEKKGFEPLQKVDAHNGFCLKSLLSPDVR